ncbi:MAG: hypothetical protein GY795_15505 [Desulfobacterales bacterium]|nr:hypothetical protein [Desulfobacterales bacterium]
MSKNNNTSCLINANRAKIDMRKFIEYALNPEHSVGGDKAVVFESVLGYNLSNYKSLFYQIKQGVTENTPLPGKADRFGARYTVDIPVRGPEGTAIVRTGWIYKPGSDIPELTTLFVKKRR